MAASKELSHSMLHGSAELIEFPCTICQTRDQREVESHKYCIDCDSNLCPACTKYHTSFPMMVTHQVVDVSQAPGTHKPLLPTQLCDKHQGKVIDKYCEDHGEVACETCINLYHSNCTQFKYIPKIAQGISKTNSLHAVKTSTDTLIKELKQKKSSQQDILQQLNKQETQTQQNVNALCTRLHQHIDSLAQSESAKIASKFQSKREAVKKDLKEVDDKIDAAEAIQTKLCQAKNDNESELFVYIKQGEKNEKDGKQLLKTLDQSQLDQSQLGIRTYKLDNSIEKSLKDTKSLGDFKKVVAVEVGLHKEINVKLASDEGSCHIEGICLLPDATMVIADSGNGNLKHLDSSYKIIQHLDLHNCPYDVCSINKNNEVAVTLCYKEKVQFVKAGATMKKTRSFNVGECCAGICCVEDELYICCGEFGTATEDKVQVFSLSGTKLRTIQYDLAGKPMLPSMSYITASPCGSKLHISGDTGVITIDRNGKQLAKINEHIVQNAMGICTFDDGELLVCGLESENLVHISEDGSRLKTLTGIKHPTALSFDHVLSRLILSTSNSDYLRLYDIQIN